MYFCVFTAVVKARFENIRCAYRKYKSQKNKASAMGKSDSRLTISRHPKPYKYAAEAAFLDVVMKSEPTVDSMDSPGTSSSEVGYCFCTYLLKLTMTHRYIT